MPKSSIERPTPTSDEPFRTGVERPESRDQEVLRQLETEERRRHVPSRQELADELGEVLVEERCAARR